MSTKRLRTAHLVRFLVPDDAEGAQPPLPRPSRQAALAVFVFLAASLPKLLLGRRS